MSRGDVCVAHNRDAAEGGVRVVARSPRSFRFPAGRGLAAAGLAGTMAGAAFLGGCGADAPAASSALPAALPVDGYVVVNTYPHDPEAFTQGLLYRDGFLFESTGLRGESTLRKVALETGEVVKEQALDARYFGEGLAFSRNRLIQLTWQAGLGFVYDPETFQVQRTFDYVGEGWGLTASDTHVILSDGSPLLRFFDPETFAETHRVTVRDAGRPVEDLNELELVGGEVLANVWHTDRLARINPATGAVVGWIDLAGLLRPGEVTNPEAVLNGIAYDEAGGRLFVTGKLWPKLFEIRIQPKE
jgi:glutamine cyclotransferase